jgi:cobalt-zinc-cadmium efflux system outer membrane protein
MRRYLLGWLACLCLPGIAPAQPASSPPAAELSLRDALAAALADSPALRARSLELKATDARIERAGQKPPLSLQADFEDFAGTGDLSGVRSLQTTLRLGAVVELGSRRDRRQELATRDQDLQSAEAERDRLDVLAKVAAAFIEGASTQALLEVRRAETAVAESTVAAVRRRIEIGAAPRFELDRAEVAVLQAQILEDHASHALASARRRLSSLMGQAEPRFGVLRADLMTLPSTAPLEEIRRRLEQNPQLRSMAAEERVAAARVRLAEASRRPDLELSLGLRRIESLDDTGVVAGFSMPLGSPARAEPSIREAMALRDGQLERQRALRLELDAVLFGLYQELQHARQQFEGLRGPMLERSTRVLQQVEAGFRQGRYSFQDYVIAQQQLGDLRRSAVEAAAKFHTLLIDIERLTGRSAAPMIE